MIQTKGNSSINYGGVTIKNLAENAVSYDLGDYGDTLSSLTDVVHILKSKGSVVSSITVTVLKGAENLGTLTTLIQAGVPLPLLVNDSGMGIKVVMASANATQIAIGDSSAGNTAETISFTFKGNITLLDV